MSNYRFVEDLSSYDKLVSNLNYQFVAFVYSTWHLDNVMANMRTNDFDHGLIVVLPSSTRRFIDENFQHPFLEKCDIIEIGRYAVKLCYKNLLRFFKSKRESTITIFSSLGLDIRLLLSLPLGLKNVRYVIYDEGTGSYCSPYYLKRDRYSSSLFAYINIYLKEGLKKIVACLVDVSMEKSLLFNIFNKRYTPNLNLVNQLRSVYENYIPVNLNISINSNSVVFFIDLANNNQEFYEKIFNQLDSSKVIYVKLHPSHKDPSFLDFIKKYNCTIIPSTISGEYAISLIRPRYILGGLSTVLYSSSAIYDTIVISLFNLYVVNNFIEEDTIYSKLNKTIGNNLIIVKSIDEISTLIK